MSYSGSQQQFGLSDLQLLQQHAMRARLQELQKQQQLGQLGDAKSQSPLNHLSLFGKQSSVGQIPNQSSGMPFNASQMFAASNINWMHRSVSSPMQGASSTSSYMHDQGPVMNPALQQSDVSLYGTPVSSGRGNLGQCSSLRGISHSSISMVSVNSEQRPIQQVSSFSNSMLHGGNSASPVHFHSFDGSTLRQGLQGKGSIGQGHPEMLDSGVSPRNSPQVNFQEKNMTLLDYNRTHGQPSFTGFLQEEAKPTNDSRETAKLDPLEEKILFDTEDSGWDTSLSKLAAIGSEELVSTAGQTEYASAFPSVQSGSWSALMQSAVAEASSSDTGVQEELSGLSFQNTEISTNNQSSNLVTSEQQHANMSTNSKLQSSSYIMGAPPSSRDFIASSAFPSFPQTSFQLPKEHAVNKISYDKTTEQQPKHLYESSENRQLKPSVPVGHLGNNLFGQHDQILSGNAQMQNISMHESRSLINGYQGSSSASPLITDTRRNNYEGAGDQFMPTAGGTADQKDIDSIGYNGRRLRSISMAVDTPNKTAAETFESQNCYQGENSSGSYNSKVSQAYTAQPDHVLNAEDSESSARSGQKSANQGKANLSVDAHSKDSPASDMSASLDSQYNSELNKAIPPIDYGSFTRCSSRVIQTEFQDIGEQNVSVSSGMAIPDIFSFQSSVVGNSRHASLGNDQKGQTWWMPPSFGHSIPQLQGISMAHNYSGNSNSLGNLKFETSNLNNERSAHGAIFSGPLYRKNQLEIKNTHNAPETSEFLEKRCSQIGQQMSLCGSPQNSYPLKNVSPGFQDPTSGALPITQPFISTTYQQNMKPLNVWMNASSQRVLMGDTSKLFSNVHSSSSPSYLHGIDRSSLASLSGNSQIIVGGEAQLRIEGYHDQKRPSLQTSEVHESVSKLSMLARDASINLAGSTNQQGCINTELNNKGSTGISGTLQSFVQSQQSHNFIVEDIKQGQDSYISTNVAETDMTGVDFSSPSASSSLNVHESVVLEQKPLHEDHTLASNPVGNQFGGASQLSFCPSGGTSNLAFSSGTSSSAMGIATSLSALQYNHFPKVPKFEQSIALGPSNGNNMMSDRISNLQIGAQMAPAWYKQYEYIKNGQMISLSDSSVLTPVKPSETFQLTGTRTNAFDGSKDCGIVSGSANQSITNEQLLHSSVLPAEVLNINLALSKPKKRKTAMYDYLPWHRKVMQACQELPWISVAEQDWAEATNRLMEKTIDTGESNEMMQPAGRAKKRLILTTQLMQQAFQPPPLTILSVDAATEYEIMAYSVARLALADACCLTNEASTDCPIPRENGNLDAARLANGWSIGHRSLLEAAEELFQRTKKLESNVNRLDRSMSVVDVRVECQELEKFCVINHFAKYHGRAVQSTATESGSSSKAVASVRPFLQRYVSAVPLPKRLPEGIQCLSL